MLTKENCKKYYPIAKVKLKRLTKLFQHEMRKAEKAKTKEAEDAVNKAIIIPQ